MVGYSLTFVGVLFAIVQGGLIRIINPALGQKKSVYLGLLLNALGLVFFAFCNTGWMMFAFLIPYCLGSIGGPAIQGIISNQVKDNEQGELQGAITSLMSVTSIIGPPLMTNLFAYFTSKSTPVYFPGAAFLLGAVLTLISLWLTQRSLSSHTLLSKVEQ